ncbi:MAG: 1-acyl-sn-glycerol-3-phosphate acyltransferase [Spirochaetes bacterium]|nr:1-acyl-sn-glycerol-3-phosphate acyltransferase [Spirochaetota bacterium]
MEPFSQKYRALISEIMTKSSGAPAMTVTEENVFQRGNPMIVTYLETMVVDQLLPGSMLRGFENLKALYEAGKAGASCLLLLEHYSNMDLPVFIYLLHQHGPQGCALADAVTAIAGIKLSETNPIVTVLTGAYTRIIIYPSRSLESVEKDSGDKKEAHAEIARAMTINRAAMKALAERKKAGDLVLVFPAGTRYRPWDPSTRRGVREIDSYLKGFDKMVFVSINGNILRINPEGEMHEDLVTRDRVVMEASPVVDCAEFRDSIKKRHHFGEDLKQAVVDGIMKRLDEMHDAVETTLKA